MVNVKTNTNGIPFIDNNHSKLANYLHPFVSVHVSAYGAGIVYEHPNNKAVFH